MSGLFADVWSEAEDGLGSAEVIAPGDYAIEAVGTGVGSNDRIWVLWSILTGPESGTTFFGPSYGLTIKDPAKAGRVKGIFKKQMIDLGITEDFFKTATNLEDFATAIKGVQGNARVTIREYKGKDGITVVQTNDIKAFALTARPALPSVGGIPAVPVQAPATPVGLPGTPDGPPLSPVVAPPVPVAEAPAPAVPAPVVAAPALPSQPPAPVVEVPAAAPAAPAAPAPPAPVAQPLVAAAEIPNTDPPF